MLSVSYSRAGSPPQVRGKLVSSELTSGEIRITPAGAGKTLQNPCGCDCTRDHPRRCGENAGTNCGNRRCLGSPPQVRGKLSSSVFACPIARITPAGAGKTGDRKNFANSERDHPRRCGENCQCFGTSISYIGSPPQVRGKRGAALPIGGGMRITPAGAGKTRSPYNAARNTEDHPRRCGENQSSPNPAHNNIGSPPQVRGKPDPPAIAIPPARITPAGAGKTQDEVTNFLEL